ncbi:hypothetical protein MSAN_00767300 [Mycena sanguinolenta]|uniref:F-box domain-containing protein n=1 Tax=Mycena sanguinolenta TaxID=230812 RepID=A0A8H6Z5P7_9AGAR|nr:hypothetical protein MSAN_00767300 [Mycena sanguinolenta]
MTHPMKTPELLREIASFLENPLYLSSLSRVDRFTRAAVMPCLFKNIKVSLDSVDSLAVALRKNASSAVSCKSLSFCERRSIKPVLRDSTEDSTSDDNASQDREFAEESAPIDANDSEGSDSNNSDTEDRHLGEGDSDSDWNESDSDGNESDSYDSDLDLSHFEPLCTDLTTVFNVISTHTALFRLSWWDWTYKDRDVTLREDVWKAIASVLGSLQELHMYVPNQIDKGWDALTKARYSNLRVLQLYMRDAHRANCTQLQSMLDALPDLEELSLRFPLCCGPYGLTFGSTHPRLRRFSLIGNVTVPDCDFLARHPRLESIDLNTLQSFSSGDSPLKMLRALMINVDSDSLARSPALIDSQISHLYLRAIGEDMVGSVAAVRAIRQSLRWLEIDLTIDHEDSYAIPLYATAVLGKAAALDELAIHYISLPWSLRSTWSSNMLSAVLDAIGTFTTLRALRIWCAQRLPQERLRDLGRLPPRLKYIGWDYHPRHSARSDPASSSVYVIEKQEGKNAVGRTLTRATTDDWMATGVLDFMGENWTP